MTTDREKLEKLRKALEDAVRSFHIIAHDGDWMIRGYAHGCEIKSRTVLSEIDKEESHA